MPDSLQSSLRDIFTALSIVDSKFVIFTLVLFFIGIYLLLLTLTGLSQKKLLAAGIRSICGIGCLAIAGIALLLALNVHTYYRLTYEKPLVNLSFTQVEPRQYRVELTYTESGTDPPFIQEEYILAGDEWQLDARVIKWKPLLQLLGFNAVYRLERLGGRYSSVEDENNLERTVYALTGNQGLDIWAAIKMIQHRVNWIDAYYGSASYMPMTDGSEFTLYITQSGLVAKPANDVARNALQNW